jgi:hypothetical protein
VRRLEVSSTTADGRLMKITKTLHCLWNASATGTINDNDAAPTSTITPASATEGSPAVFEFSLSNPSAVDTTYILYIHQWNGWKC